jgi:CRISPR-associated protein Cas1
VDERDEGIYIVLSPEGISVTIDGWGFGLRVKGERLIIARPRKAQKGRETRNLLPADPDLNESETRILGPPPEDSPEQISLSPEQPENPSAGEGRALQGAPSNEDHLELPLRHLSEIIIVGNGGYLTTDLISAAMERGIALHITDRSGKPIAAIAPHIHTATVEIRRAQVASASTRVGRHIAYSLIASKLHNQAALLKYFSKYQAKAEPEKARILRETAREIVSLIATLPPPSESRPRRLSGSSAYAEQLMGIEGAGASAYWKAVAHLIPEELSFPGRQHRGATDPVNALLNYGYGILYSHCWSAVLRAGLDPYAGFLHADRPGKPSLVLDLVEEFRAPVVDRTVIAFVRLSGEARLLASTRAGLSREVRARIADKILERLDSREPHLGRKEALRNILQIQARQIAALVRRRQSSYHPYRARW